MFRRESNAMQRFFSGQFARFCMVGLVGFAVDAATLELLVAADILPLIARIASIGMALQITYMLHSRVTFHQAFTARRWWPFMLANGLGAGINYGVFMAVWLLHTMDNSTHQRYVALLASTAVALCFNYWANRRFVFKELP
jgi:putative flippase GtrA